MVLKILHRIDKLKRFPEIVRTTKTFHRKAKSWSVPENPTSFSIILVNDKLEDAVPGSDDLTATTRGHRSPATGGHDRPGRLKVDRRQEWRLFYTRLGQEKCGLLCLILLCKI